MEELAIRGVRPRVSAPGGEPTGRGLYPALSHEICRPLISLRAGFDLLLAGCEGPISEGQRDDVQALRFHCDDMIRLTRSYLDFAGLAVDSKAADRTPYRLGSLLAEADLQCAGLARVKGVGWTWSIEGDDASVVTDLACFQQVVGRLIARAIAEAPAGGSVALVGRVEGPEWVVEVGGDRLRAGEPRPVDGRQVGLAVAQALAARLGGSIEAREGTDGGSVVSVRFPIGLASV